MLTCKRNKGFIAHIDKLRSYLDAPEEIHLGRKPDDLLETLVNREQHRLQRYLSIISICRSQQLSKKSRPALF